MAKIIVSPLRLRVKPFAPSRETLAPLRETTAHQLYMECCFWYL